MRSLLERRLLVVTGKGGVGKTTISAALAVSAASAGARTIVVELGGQQRMPELFGHPARETGVETRLRERLSSISIDPDQALREWLQALGGRVPGRLLASSGTFHYFAAAAPGAREIVSMVKIWELTLERRWLRQGARYDLVVLDAPATGNALGMLGSPQTFAAIARVGAVAKQANEVQQLLEDPARSAYVAVALPSEMAVTETLELQQGVHEAIGRDLSAVVVNALLPQRFTAAELERVSGLAVDGAGAGGGRGADAEVRRAAVRAARTVHERARFQHNQLARLRRRSFEVFGVPFVWGEALEESSIVRIAEQLGRRV
jgi:anion-transporting  ArsA/GET3 family ATPase